MLYIVYKWCLLLPVLSHHFDHLVGTRLVLFLPSRSPIIFKKSLRRFRYSQWLRNGIKNSDMGVLSPSLISTTKVNSVTLHPFGLLYLPPHRWSTWRQGCYSPGNWRIASHIWVTTTEHCGVKATCGCDMVTCDLCSRQRKLKVRSGSSTL